MQFHRGKGQQLSQKIAVAKHWILFAPKDSLLLVLYLTFTNTLN